MNRRSFVQRCLASFLVAIGLSEKAAVPESEKSKREQLSRWYCIEADGTTQNVHPEFMKDGDIFFVIDRPDQLWQVQGKTFLNDDGIWSAFVKAV